jgi:serine phosphatase RsbU (regulator of sigma subunit)
MTRNRSIRHRLLGDQVLLILLLGGALLATTFLGARRAVEGLSRTLIEQATDRADSELRRFFDPVASALEAVRSWDEAGLLPGDSPRAWRDLMLPVAERLPQISGMLLADNLGNERFLASVDDAWHERITRVDERGLGIEWLGAAPPQEAAGTGNSGYDPRTRPWFVGALTTPGSIHWTEPYEFFTRQSLGVTAAVGYPTGDGGERVAALDVSLADLSRHARGIRVSDGGGLWVLTEDRRLLAWPDNLAVWGDVDPTTALLRSPRELGLPLVDDAAEALGDRPVDELATPTRFSSQGRDWWAAGRRFELSAERTLLIVVAVPHADLLAERARLRWWILGLTLVMLLAAIARAFALARRFSEPIEALVHHTDRIRQGDLEPAEPVASGLSEVHRLADAHERMRRGLKTLLKLEGDLQLARQIQQNTWPRRLPRLAGFDMVAWSLPADETGGDSYDVVGLAADGSLTDGDAESAVLMLADATGHGIGPALSVTQLRAMLRMAVRTGSDLQGMAAHMNAQLYADLPGNRFITTWLGLLHVDGTLATYSGGQAPLLVYSAESDEVEIRKADVPPFGLLPPLPVVLPPPTALHPGDIYVVLSDGFFEAKNPGGEELGTESVLGVIRRHHRAGAEEILGELRALLSEFTQNGPFDDDRTAVIIKRAG